MLASFLAFNFNAASGFVYVITSNPWFFLLAASALGTILLQMNEEVEDAVREEQNII